MSDGAPAATLELLYRLWWLHDGRWYQETASRFGFEVANEINKSALRFLAQRVGKMVAQELGRPITELEWPEVVKTFCRGAELMWPAEALQFRYEITGPGQFQVDIERNFALEMLARAGTLEHYDCPCLELRAGWFEGLGLHPVENRIEQCLCKGAGSCRLVARVQEFSPEGES